MDLVLLATIATAVFTGWAIIDRRIYQPRPRWQIDFDASDMQPMTDTHVAMLFGVTNIGYGVALAVRIESSSVSTFQNVQSRSSRLESGERLILRLAIPASDAKAVLDAYGDTLDFNAAIDLTGVTVTLIWAQPPFQSREKRKKYQLDRIATTQPGL